jgi:thiamine transport system permease protein
VFYLWPLATLLWRVLGLSAIVDALRRPGVVDIAWFTLWQAVVSTAATVVVGLPPALLLSRYDFRGRRALRALVTVPFLLPTVVVGAAFVSLLPERLDGTATAVIAAHVFFNVAVVVRVVGASWAQLPSDLTAAARTLGASPSRAWVSVTLPMLRSSIVAASLVVFLFTFTSFGAVQILGGPANPTIEVEVARRALQLGDVRGAAALAVLQLAFLGVVIGCGAWVQRRSRVRIVFAAAARRRPVGRSQRAAIVIGAGLTAIAMGAPLLALVSASVRIDGRWTLVAWRELGEEEVRPGLGLGVDAAASILRSVGTATAATVIAVVVGTSAACAVAIARRHGRLLDVGLMLPLATSAVTVGLGMLITFDRAPVDWRGSTWLVPVGHALVAAPFVVRTVLPVLTARPPAWLDAAATLGASPTRAWLAIDVPLLRRPLVVAAAFAAAISLGEFGATTFLTRSGRETMPVAIARLLGRAGDIPRAQGFVLATMLAVVTGLLILVVDALDRDRIAGRSD